MRLPSLLTTETRLRERPSVVGPAVSSLIEAAEHGDQSAANALSEWIADAGSRAKAAGHIGRYHPTA